MLFSQGGKPADEGTWLARGPSEWRRWGPADMLIVRVVRCEGGRGGLRGELGRAARRRASGLGRGALGVCAWGGGRKRMWGFEHLSGRPDVRGAPDVRVLD
jgi:hypothetical protein